LEVKMKSLLLKRTVLAGIAALTITAAGLGVVGVQQISAATPTPTATGGGDRQAEHQKFLEAVAGKLGISADKLKQAFEDARKDLGFPDHSTGGQPGKQGGPDGERRGPGGFLKPAADKLGITVEQLFQELQGKTLTDVAKAHNVKPDDLAKALKDAANAQIDQEKANGRILTDGQVADAKKWASDRVDILMAKVFTPHQRPGGFGPGGPGQDQPGGFGPRRFGPGGFQDQAGGFGPRGFHERAAGFEIQQHGPRF
jgi:hypothetical protein